MAKGKNFLLAVLLTAFLSGCSSITPWTNCVDCDQFPLVYQGTIQEYTQGVYIETACLTIDISNLFGSRDFSIGDIIYIEYIVKQGDFCAPDDESTYRIYTVDKPGADSPPIDVKVQGTRIQMKEQSSAENDPPIIPVMASMLMLAGLFNFGTYTPTTNSRTKLAAWIACLLAISWITASFYPETTGIIWEVSIYEKVMGYVSAVTVLLGLIGVRNLTEDWIGAIKQGKDPEVPKEE